MYYANALPKAKISPCKHRILYEALATIYPQYTPGVVGKATYS